MATNWISSIFPLLHLFLSKIVERIHRSLMADGGRRVGGWVGWTGGGTPFTSSVTPHVGGSTVAAVRWIKYVWTAWQIRRIWNVSTWLGSDVTWEGGRRGREKEREAGLGNRLPGEGNWWHDGWRDRLGKMAYRCLHKKGMHVISLTGLDSWRCDVIVWRHCVQNVMMCHNVWYLFLGMQLLSPFYF